MHVTLEILREGASSSGRGPPADPRTPRTGNPRRRERTGRSFFSSSSPRGGPAGECDIAVETERCIVFMELKKKHFARRRLREKRVSEEVVEYPTLREVRVQCSRQS